MGGLLSAALEAGPAGNFVDPENVVDGVFVALFRVGEDEDIRLASIIIAGQAIIGFVGLMVGSGLGGPTERVRSSFRTILFDPA